jgi:excinuclease ABC subunit C
MVVFGKGVPRKSDYRRFRIRGVDGADDYAMLQEVLRRRFKRVAKGQDKVENVQDAWGILPDLLIVDGGKGQLNAARDVMTELGVDHIPTIGLAKQREEVFVSGRSKPILLPRDSEGLYLLQRVRDEAHRFAITYHRSLRKRKGLTSKLDTIPGIGAKRRQALMRHFGSLDAIRDAPVEELAAVSGMNAKVAEKVKEHL